MAMMEPLQLFYDKTADVLYISARDPRVGISEELGDDVLLRLDADTGEEVGITVLNFSQRFDTGEVLTIPVSIRLRQLGKTQKRLDLIGRHSTLSDTDFQQLMSKCTSLLPIEGSFLVDDYVENLLLTVLDFQLRSTTVERAMQYYRQHTRPATADFSGLKRLLAAYPDTQAGNLQAAQALWSYRYWNRIEMLRKLMTYFEDRGVTTQEQLQQWAMQADFKRDFKGRIKGLGYAVFQWLIMRQGVESIKPDVWIHRFLRDTLGYSVSDETAVAMLKEIALELGVKAYELDWRIWQYQTGRQT